MKNLILTFALVVTCGVFTPQLSMAQCSNASVIGPYGFKLAGFSPAQGGAAFCRIVIIGELGPTTPAVARPNVVNPNQLPGTLAVVGLMVANGSGRLTDITSSSSIDGQITRFYTYTGSYTVNPDCTGSLTMYSGTSGQPVNYDFVIAKGGAELFLVGTDSGLAVTGTAIHQ